jgi:hypothetical protein
VERGSWSRNVFAVAGNHGDAGDIYDKGRGGIFHGAYTQFFAGTFGNT